MKLRMGLVVLVAPDCETALDFLVGGPGFELVEDRPNDKKRWVVV